jgi:Ca2+/Na+ antiporter
VLVLVGERACDLIRGTASCGTAGGFMLLVIGGLMVFVGTRLLRALDVPQAGTTSMLGVALLAIALLTVLLDQVFSLWMWVVLPLLAAALYAFAAWAAVRLAEAGSG